MCRTDWQAKPSRKQVKEQHERGEAAKGDQPADGLDRSPAATEDEPSSVAATAEAPSMTGMDFEVESPQS